MADLHAGEWFSRRVPAAGARLRCCECGVLSDERARGWRAVRAGGIDRDAAPGLLVFCPHCGDLEFENGQDIRRRFWIELGLAVSSGVLLVFVLVRRDWIEYLFGVDPDKDSGSLEWELPVLLLVATVTFSVLARVEWVEAARVARRTQRRRRHTDWPRAE